MIVIASLIFGVNPLEMIGALERRRSACPERQPAAAATGRSAPAPAARRRRPPTDPSKDLAAACSATPRTCGARCSRRWAPRYEPPRLVLFRGAARSACGRASAAAGPFYCSADRKLYLDTAFFDELSRRFGAPGDFAQAYVIAHEVGHHVQNLTGTMQKVDRADAAHRRARAQRAVGAPRAAGRLLRRRLGLFRAEAQQARAGRSRGGIHGRRGGRRRLDPEARARATSCPESFTHGTAEQRLRWFKTGLESGDMRRCDTFAAREP